MLVFQKERILYWLVRQNVCYSSIVGFAIASFERKVFISIVGFNACKRVYSSMDNIAESSYFVIIVLLCLLCFIDKLANLCSLLILAY